MDGRYSEWLNRNAHRAFPFAEDSDMSCADGRLPQSLVLDARFCDCAGPLAPFELVGASVSGGVASLSFRHGPSTVVVSGSGLVHGSSGGVSYMVYVGECPDGEWVPNVPVPVLPSRVLSVPGGIGVDSLTCGDATASGSVRIADGHNTELYLRDNSIHLRVGKGFGLGQKCPDRTEDVDTCEGRVLRFLNGQKADSDGTLTISGGDGVTVTSGEYDGIPAIVVTTAATVNQFLYKNGT